MEHVSAPRPGERILVEHRGGATLLRVSEVLAEQPLADDGIFVFVDHYDERRLCRADADGFSIVGELELSPAQQNLVYDVLFSPAPTAGLR